MGIEKFFNSLIKKDNKLNSEVLVNYKPNVKYLYIDFNSILYKIAEDIESELNNLLYELIYDGDIHSEKNKIVSKKWGYDISISFEDFFTDNLIQDYLYKEIDNNLEYIYNNIIDSHNIEYIYISIDGIPNMAKIVEQKRRRYMGYIIGESKKYITEKYTDSIGKKRTTYEKSRVKISRGKFFSSDPFMKNVSNKLDSQRNNIFKTYPKLKYYIISGPDVPGEGEKKIMENIIAEQHDGTVAIYSPDSDMIILSSILLNMVPRNCNIYVIRYDQQNKNYDIAFINIFIDNIIEYIKSNNNWLISDMDTINDIMFIFTMFGNDFVHKIESIDAKKDSDILLDIYIKTMYNKTKGIIKNGVVELHNMIEYFKDLSMYEGFLICDTYLSKRYKNYKHLKSQFINHFWYDTLHKTLIVYFKVANIIYKNIDVWNRHIKKNNIENTKKYIHDGLNNIKLQINTILDTYNDKIRYNFDDVLNIFAMLEMNIDIDHVDRNNIVELLINKILERKKLVPSVRLDKYDYTINSKYHLEKIKRFMPSSSMMVTDMDRELYEYEFMLGKYRNIMNASDDKIGICELKYVNNQYIYIYDSFKNIQNNFYKLYSDKSDTSILSNRKNPKDSINNMCEKYIEGVLWVYDFYYKKNDIKYNYNNVSTWFYEGHISPLITDIYEYLKKNQHTDIFNDITRNISKKIVNREKFFDSVYHYLYVTPKNNINNIDYKTKYVDRNPDIYPDLNYYVLDIMNDIDTKNIINCGRATFVTKCVLLPIIYPSYELFMIKNNI